MSSEVKLIDIIVPFAGGVLIFSMLFIFIIYFILLYRKKQVKYEFEKEQAKQLLLKTQIEIKEQTLSDISRELHDNFGQVASLIKINLNMIDVENIQNSQGQINDSKELLKQLILDIKSLSTTLKGENLQRFGLINMIQKDIERLNKSSGLKFSLNGDTEIPELTSEQQIFLYRISQEIFNNVIQHANATEANLTIDRKNGKFLFIFADNGSGFDTQTNKEGNGLINMRERCKIINAKLEILSQKTKGTKITITLDTHE
ncbi:MAG: sensor histidine kinase [Putridiphycobacter sp.]